MVPEGVAEAEVDFGEIGVECDGLAEGGDGGVGLAFELEEVGEVVEGFGVVGLEGDGFAVGGEGEVEFALVFQDAAHVVGSAFGEVRV